MLVRLLVLAAIALAAPAAAPGAARDLTAADRAGFVAAVSRFQTAYQRRDGAALAALMPPRVVARIVAEAADDGARRAAMAARIEARLGREDRIELAVQPGKARFGTTPDGLAFGLAPITRVAVRRDGEPLEVTRPVDGRLKRVKVVAEYEMTAWAHVLGLFEDGTWYLVGLTDPDAAEALLAVYPAFREIGLPRVRSQMQARSVIVE